MKAMVIGVTVATFGVASAIADEKRALDAHEHGVSVLNIAVEGDTVAMELEAPGADIVGFEYVATSAEDKAAVAQAEADLLKPLTLFAPSPEAGCSVTSADAHLVSDADHDHDHGDHSHEEHAEKEHAHDDHDHDKHDDAEHAHDEHGHDEHAHDEHAHDHGDEAVHSEFRAEYVLTCSNIGALTAIGLPFFDRFENAQEIDATLVTDKGQTRVEVERADGASIDVSGAI